MHRELSILSVMFLRGQTVGKYRIVATLGSGGLTVFKAVQTTRTDVSRSILSTVNSDFGVLSSRLETLERDTVRSADLANVRDSVLAEVRAGDSAVRTELGRELERKADAAALVSTQQRLDRELTTVGSRLTRIDSDLSRLRS